MGKFGLVCTLLENVSPSGECTTKSRNARKVSNNFSDSSQNSSTRVFYSIQPFAGELNLKAKNTIGTILMDFLVNTILT